VLKKVFFAAAVIFLFSVCMKAQAGIIVEREGDYYQDDEIAGHVHKPYAERVYDWPESKTGKVTLKTNNLGFREDRDTVTGKEKGAVRVLVAGDSQVDGVVENNASFPHLLEKALNAESQGIRFEFLNGGTGYYGPDHYLLFLQKYLFLKPDIYIVVIYTGNDFLDAARVVEAQGTTLQRPPEYFKSLRDCGPAGGAVDQAMNQAYYFKTFPAMKEATLRHTLEVIRRIEKLCKQQSIELLIVLLPTKADVEWASDAESLDRVSGCLALDEQGLGVNRAMAQTLAAELAKRSIRFFDAYGPLRNAAHELYWKKDYHLNDEGHKLLAQKLQSAVDFSDLSQR